MKIICTDKKFVPDFLAHNLVIIPHIHVNTLFIYLVAKYVSTWEGTKEDSDNSHRTGHRLNSIMECHLPIQSPFRHSFLQHVPTVLMMKLDGRYPKSVLKLT